MTAFQSKTTVAKLGFSTFRLSQLGMCTNWEHYGIHNIRERKEGKIDERLRGPKRAIFKEDILLLVDSNFFSNSLPSDSLAECPMIKIQSSFIAVSIRSQKWSEYAINVAPLLYTQGTGCTRTDARGFF